MISAEGAAVHSGQNSFIEKEDKQAKIASRRFGAEIGYRYHQNNSPVPAKTG
jgi:hypothetical protein